MVLLHAKYGTLVSARLAFSFGVNVGRKDHLFPLFSFFDDELAELSRRACKWWAYASQVSRDFRVSNGGVDLAVELANDLGRRLLQSNSFCAACRSAVSKPSVNQE